MAWYFWVLSIFGGIICLIALIGFLSPRIAKMQRSVSVNADAATIFKEMEGLKAFNNWSPWADKDPDAVFEFSGPETGVGSHFTWKGNKSVGTGNMTITDSVTNEKVTTALDFGSRGKAIACWVIEPAGDACKVTWTFEGDMGNNPAGRIMGRMMDKFLGPDYEKGLNSLKQIVEKA